MQHLSQHRVARTLARFLPLASGLAMLAVLTLAIGAGRQGHGHLVAGEVFHHNHFFFADHAHPDSSSQLAKLGPQSASPVPDSQTPNSSKPGPQAPGPQAPGPQAPGPQAPGPQAPEPERSLPTFSTALPWSLPVDGLDVSATLSAIELLPPAGEALLASARPFDPATPRGPPV